MARTTYGTSDAGAQVASGLPSFFTNFPNAEFTNGLWLLGQQDGIDWTDPTTSLNTAYGTQSAGSGATDDSLALLSAAWTNDQYGRATIFQDPTLAGNTFEVEILLRAQLTANSFTAYECNLAFDGGYAQIVRLNGPLNSFTYVNSGGGGGPRPVTGDIFEAQIVGTIVTMWLTHGGTRAMLNQADVASIGAPVYTGGKVGVGFWHGNNARRYGFTDLLLQGL